MQLKTFLKQSLLIVGIVGFLLSLMILYSLFCLGYFHKESLPSIDHQADHNSTGDRPAEHVNNAEHVDNAEHIDNAALPKQASPGIPIHLRIPKISVDAKIDSAGITSDGAVSASKGPADVAWFDLGPRPGDNGSAVIVGHYGKWKNGEGSVFDDLSKLIPGDKVYVEDEKGTTVSFVVRELRTYDRNENVPEVFSSDDGKAHLNLITCKGVWIEVERTYSNRLIVFADKEI
jgi:LPXTG-site transpeptidase (sortase) family protein